MIYDISQELFSCRVWPGDPAPERDLLADMSKGDIINLTAFSMCAHNGTHLDAPAHFIKEGKTVTELNPAAYLGDCYLTHHEGDVTAADARRILAEAAARVFAEAGILLIGNESQTVGPENAPMAVHLILLGADIVLLEGLVLSHVPAGKYFLTAAPIHLGGCEGAPCRAMLVEI